VHDGVTAAQKRENRVRIAQIDLFERRLGRAGAASIRRPHVVSTTGELLTNHRTQATRRAGNQDLHAQARF
jgi:hypothetical protein